MPFARQPPDLSGNRHSVGQTSYRIAFCAVVTVITANTNSNFVIMTMASDAQRERTNLTHSSDHTFRSHLHFSEASDTHTRRILYTWRVLIPTPIYGSGDLVWQKKNESRINEMEMRSLRSASGVSLEHRFRNSDVRERGGLKEDVMDRVEKGVLRWLGNLAILKEISKSYGGPLSTPSPHPPSDHQSSNFPSISNITPSYGYYIPKWPATHCRLLWSCVSMDDGDHLHFSGSHTRRPFDMLYKKENQEKGRKRE
ncbi:hypothetical protein EVAR_26459_1 [Eumeta japonica]|uniref:Uncharacterized protein n=1 Tax=Eumeta variegata TaxID=151549 RepID=A0A4C1Z036_EUMVA|nr:hypothetical protein EVAR_26459_1 [Eumeta japonica]